MFYDRQTDKLYTDDTAMEGVFSKIKEKVKGIGKKKTTPVNLTPISKETYENEVRPLLKETFKKLAKATTSFYNKSENSRFKKGCSITSGIGSVPTDFVTIVSYDLGDYVSNPREYEEPADEPNGRGIFASSNELMDVLKPLLQDLSKYYKLENEGDWDTWSISLAPKFKIEN